MRKWMHFVGVLVNFSCYVSPAFAIKALTYSSFCDVLLQMKEDEGRWKHSFGSCFSSSFRYCCRNLLLLSALNQNKWLMCVVRVSLQDFIFFMQTRLDCCVWNASSHSYRSPFMTMPQHFAAFFSVIVEKSTMFDDYNRHVVCILERLHVWVEMSFFSCNFLEWHPLVLSRQDDVMSSVEDTQ